MEDAGEVVLAGLLRERAAALVDRHSKHSAARLWRAITEPDELTAWMGFPSKVDLRPGGDYVVDSGGDDGALDGIIVRIEDVAPPRRHRGLLMAAKAKAALGERDMLLRGVLAGAFLGFSTEHAQLEIMQCAGTRSRSRSGTTSAARSSRGWR